MTDSEAQMPTWWVRYSYDGGAGMTPVSAPDRETAAQLGMEQAVPLVRDKDKPCRLTSVMRIVRIGEMEAAEHYGIARVVDLDWDSRDTGGDWLIVERGSTRDAAGYDVWTDTGRLVGTGRTAAGAEKRAQVLRNRHPQGSACYHVVPRDAVTMGTSGAPYGCMSGAVTA